MDQVIDMDRRGKIWRNLKNPPVKDTVGVPDGGFTIIRFLADNPALGQLASPPSSSRP